jgi:dTDP-4-amino-4,6-dideoxygalactose transaminase
MSDAANTDDEFLPFFRPSIGDEERGEILDTLRSDWLTTGPKTRRFEEAFAEYVGARHAVATSSCTAGLHLALVACGIGDGDEVVVPSLTFCATANVAVHQRARPVFVDVDEASYTMDAGAFERAITPRTKAVIPVDYGGQVCDMTRINEIAAAHGITVIEDAAHSVGAALNGVRVGRLARLTSFSFYATKNLTTGEGGMVTTDDGELAGRIRVLGLHGISADAWKRYSKEGSWFYEVLWPGYKYNMTDIQASLGLHQLAKLEQFTERRTWLARQYSDAFADLPEIVTPIVRPGVHHAWHLYPIRVLRGRLRLDRAEFIAAMASRGIGASVHFIPVHLHPYYRDTWGCRRGDLPVTERVFDELVSLPLFPSMTGGELAKVIDVIRELVTTNRV